MSSSNTKITKKRKRSDSAPEKDAKARKTEENQESGPSGPCFWLMKSEPDVYSWQRLTSEKRGVWDGVRNRQASNFLKKMKVGDLAFFYHSVKEKSVVGVCKIVKESYPDPTDETKSWVAVDVEPYAPFTKPVSLEQIKATPELGELKLVKQSRLSVMPIGQAEWDKILSMGSTTLLPPSASS